MHNLFGTVREIGAFFTLHPPERLLDLLVLARAGPIAGMPSSAPVDRRATTDVVLRDVRRAAAFATARGEVGGVIVLVAAHRAAGLCCPRSSRAQWCARPYHWLRSIAH